MSIEGLKDLAAIVGPIITASTFVVAYRFGARQLRLNTRNSFQTMLLDVDKALIDKPELWAVYDNYESLTVTCKEKILLEAKLRGFVYMKLNMFEIVFAYYEESRRLLRYRRRGLAPIEHETYQTWRHYFQEFLSGSTLARTILHEERSRRLYSPRFLSISDEALLEVGHKGINPLSSNNTVPPIS